MAKARRVCERALCTKRPHFAQKGQKPLRCGEHRTTGDIDVTTRRCKADCGRRAYYGKKGSVVEYCATHRPSKQYMRLVARDKCHRTTCTTTASYGIPGGKAKFCSRHKKEPFTHNVVNRTCQFAKCMRQPSFGTQERRPVFCREHHDPNKHRNVMMRLCHAMGCLMTRTYGHPGGKPTYCSKHGKERGLVLLCTKCEHPDCTIIPSYGTEWGKPITCRQHKREGFFSVKGKICAIPTCETRATFGTERGRPITCRKHAPPFFFCVVGRKCVEQGCHTAARYGRPGNKKMHCYTHRKRGEVPILCQSCTAQATCKEKPIFGSKHPERCQAHKLDSDLNLVERNCTQCNIQDILMEDDKCQACTLFPQIMRTNRLKKQRAVQGFLDANEQLRDYDFCDRPIFVPETGGCSPQRPDFLWDCHTHVVVLEIDEEQHKHYDPVCEETRMINIANNLFRPTVFVRFNPDTYKGQTRHFDRLEELKRWIIRLRDSKPEYYLGVVYLFYDLKKHQIKKLI
jgi:hypothetical protein